MERSAFFNSVAGDRKYKAEIFAGYFSKFITNGIFPLPADNLRIAAYDRMEIKAHKGTGYINGYLYENTDTLILKVSTADGLKPRIDKVVLRWSQVDRNIRIYIKEGIPNSNPTAPSLERGADIYELGLANIYVAQGAYEIREADITDIRLDTESCGIVNSILQADTTAIFNQYQSWFNLRTSQYDAELNAFLDGYEGDKADWVTAMEAWTTATKAWYENSLAQFLNEYEAAKAQWLANMNAWFTTTTSTFETELLTKQEEYSTRAEDYLAQIESLIGDAEAGELLNRVRWLQENLGFIPIDAGDFFETYVDYSPDGGEF
jgi:hypothetical protein